MPPLEIPSGLRDGDVLLRALADSDVDAYVSAFRDDAELGALLGIEQDPDEERLRGRIARMPDALADGRFAELAIADVSDGRLLGSLTLHAVDWANGRGELGFFVVPAERRRGVCRAAISLALDWAFGSLGFERVEMTTTPGNAAVAALAESLGFVREGVLRSRNLERGRRVDVVWFGLLRDEWSASRT